MLEKRREKRMPVSLQLEISSLFKQENVNVTNFYAPIQVFDISKTGIGFTSTSVLPIDYYFNAKIILGDPDSALNCVVRIIRAKKVEDNITIYGCEFVGLAPVLYYIFDEYEEHFTHGE